MKLTVKMIRVFRSRVAFQKGASAAAPDIRLADHHKPNAADRPSLAPAAAIAMPLICARHSSGLKSGNSHNLRACPVIKFGPFTRIGVVRLL